MTKMIQDGYGCLLAALNEAHGRERINGSVQVTMLGSDAREWDCVTGDHLERDGRVHLGSGIIVLPDSTLQETGGHVDWRGGHTMPNGDRTVRFNMDGVACTLKWNDPAQAQIEDAA